MTTAPITGPRVVLASSSPRRRELVAHLALDVETLSPDGYEAPPAPDESPENYTLRLATDKAEQGARMRPGSLVIGADTCVVFQGDILGKPADADDAAATLRRLRGREHSVVTGVCVRRGDTSPATALRRTRVWMRDYSDREIAAYVASGKPMDKAGSYAIQDIDFDPVSRYEGCYLNVVGFPLCAVVETLKAQGVAARLKRPGDSVSVCGDCELAIEPAGGAA